MPFDDEQRALLWSLELNRRSLLAERRRLSEIPTEREKLERRRRDSQRRIEELAERKRELALKQQQLELKVEELKSRRNKHRTQLLHAGDNREYATLLREIDTEQKQQNELEDQILELMEEFERAAGEHGACLKEKAAVDDEVERRLGELEAEDRQRRAELERHERLSGELQQSLDSNTLRLYTRLDGRGAGGSICSLVTNYKCGVCGMEVATLTLSRVRSGEFRQCDSCSAVLVDEEQVAVARRIARARGYLAKADDRTDDDASETAVDADSEKQS
ncbi:MAG: hypothetical protein GF403_05970 [Candidatus Coatesbacteria bacterium]|nr:hypothetical protein [Candidatus Coatesbacteria bacterium]